MSVSLASPPLNALAPALLDAAIKSFVVLLLAGGAAIALRRAAAAARHLVWSLAVTGLLVLPVVSAALPAWRILPAWLDVAAEPPLRVTRQTPPAGRPALPSEAAERETAHAPLLGGPTAPDAGMSAGAPSVPAVRADAGPPGRTPVASTATQRTWQAEGLVPYALAAWALGVLAVLVPQVTGRLRLWRLARTSPPIADAARNALVEEASERLGLRQKVLLVESDQRSMPMVWGILTPKLLLPAGCSGWPRGRVWVALLHELAHVQRFDCLTKMLAHLACALYWFNPLVWVALRRLQTEAELACDDVVLRAGPKPCDYAEHLLEIAAGRRVGLLAAQGGIAMARPSRLEGRVRAILGARRRRGTVTRVGVAAAIVVVVSLITLLAVVRSRGPEPESRRGPKPVGPARKVDAATPTKDPDRAREPAVGEGPLDRQPDRRPWGPPIDGVRCHLEADKPVWRVGETPTLKAIVHHLGDAKLWLALHVAFGCQLEVDGHRYHWGGPLLWGGPTIGPSTRWEAKPFPISLGKDWQKVADKEPLKLAPGRHTIRFGWAGHRDLKGGIEGGEDSRILLMSNPVEIEIVAEDEAWGEAVEGVRCHLEADKPVWRVGETPRLKAIVHHEGDAKLWLALHVGFGCQLEVDGHKYLWRGPWDWTGPSVNPSTRWEAKPFPISLDRDWQRIADNAPLKLAPGDHTIRFGWAGSRGPEGRVAEGEDARILLMSNPVEIDIVPDPRAWGPPIDGVRCRLEPDKPLWRVGETPTLKAIVHHEGDARLWLMLHVGFGCQLEVDGHTYHWRGLMVWDGPDVNPSTRWEDRPFPITLSKEWQRVADGEPLALAPGRHTVRFGWAGRRGQNGAIDTGEDSRILLMSNPVEIEIVPDDEAWGEAVEGVQVRLRAEKKAWQEGETPKFEADVRNEGERDLELVLSAAYWRIELDSVWYHSTFVHFALIGVMPFGPGRRYSPAAVARFLANPVWKWRSDEGDKPLTFTPGKHIVRVAFRARATKRAGGKDVRAVSNPVEIEILPAAADEDDERLAFGGTVVDAETGKPVERFGLQWGWPDPKDPAKVTWGGTESAIARKGGRFRKRTQTEKGSKAWLRILADGYLPEPVTPAPVTVPSRRLDLVVRLRRGGDIRGRVLDHAGEPVANAKVFLAGHQYVDLIDGKAQGFGGSRATTDAEGRFVLRGAGGKANRVIVSAPSLHAWNVAAPAPGQELTIRLPEPATLALRYDIDGDEPVARFHFRLRAWEMEGWRQVAGSTQNPTAPNKGETVLRNVTPGVYNLARWKNVRAGQFGQGFLCDRQTVTLKSGETTEIQFVRKTGHPITGRIAGLYHAVPGVFVRVESAEADAGARTPEGWATIFDALTCEPNGRFKTARIPVGACTLIAEAYGPPKFPGRTGERRPDFVGTAKVTVTADGPPPEVTIQMRPRAAPGKGDEALRAPDPGKLRGRVVDHNGEPVAKAVVFLVGERGVRLRQGERTDFDGPRAATDAEGRFVLRGAAAEESRLVVSAPSLYVWVVPVPNERKEWTIRLPEPATLILRYDMDGYDAEATFRLHLHAHEMKGWEGAVSAYQSATAPNGGRAVLVNMAPGIYDLHRHKILGVGDAGMSALCERRKITLKAGERAEIHFVRKGGHRITGRVVGLPKGAVPGVFVWVQSNDFPGFPMRDGPTPVSFDFLTCEPNGPFETAPVPPGRYTLKAHAFKPLGDAAALGGAHPSDFIGSAKVVVPKDGPPPPVRLEMKPRAE